MFSIYRDQTAMTSLQGTWEHAEPALKEAILQATRRLDRLLQDQPQEQGESREGRSRILFEAPLGIIFEVDEAMKLVRILQAWTFRTAADRRNGQE